MRLAEHEQCAVGNSCEGCNVYPSDDVSLHRYEDQHALSERPGAALQKRSDRFDSGMRVFVLLFSRRMELARLMPPSFGFVAQW